jgi:hypothetical protein
MGPSGSRLKVLQEPENQEEFSVEIKNMPCGNRYFLLSSHTPLFFLRVVSNSPYLEGSTAMNEYLNDLISSKRLSKGRIPESGSLDQLLEESLADVQKLLAVSTARTSKRTTAQ